MGLITGYCTVNYRCCIRINRSSHYRSHYAKGVPVKLINCDWFYGNVTEEQAEAELSTGGASNKFLVRKTSKTLILSSKIQEECRHNTINYSPKGYNLDGRDSSFSDISELIAHYQKFSIDEERHWLLGVACDRKTSGTVALQCCNEQHLLIIQHYQRWFNRTLAQYWNRKFKRYCIALFRPYAERLLLSI